MKTIRYDFEPINDIYRKIIERDGKSTLSDMNELKKELNKFFKDSYCRMVYYTDNVDKPFFGMRVVAKIDPDFVYDYLISENPQRITEYLLEIDSKLFNPIMDLSPREITAITLHEIGHLVNDTTPIVNARNYMTSYLTDNQETISMTDSVNYREILAFGLKDFLSKDRSMFYTNDDDEILADEFVRGCGYGKYLESAMDKIVHSQPKLYANEDISKFAVFAWSLRIYKGLRLRRVGALRTLAKAKSITASKLEKMEMDNIMRRIRSIDDNSLIEAESSNIVKSKLKKMRYQTMRSLDDDYYEINMRVRNVDDEDDALYLMRQINTRIGIIDDYLNTEDLEDHEKKKWFAAMDRFKALRDKLSSATVYKSKTYGIYVNYPDIKPDNY